LDHIKLDDIGEGSADCLCQNNNSIWGTLVIMPRSNVWEVRCWQDDGEKMGLESVLF